MLLFAWSTFHYTRAAAFTCFVPFPSSLVSVSSRAVLAFSLLLSFKHSQLFWLSEKFLKFKVFFVSSSSSFSWKMNAFLDAFMRSFLYFLTVSCSLLRSFLFFWRFLRWPQFPRSGGRPFLSPDKRVHNRMREHEPPLWALTALVRTNWMWFDNHFRPQSYCAHRMPE